MNGKPRPQIPADGMELPPLLNSEQARRALGNMPESTFRLLTKSGGLVTKRIGARVYVRREDLVAYIDGLPSAAQVAA